jgi:hypothetical protein
MTGTNVQLVDVVDPAMEGEPFAHLRVKAEIRLETIDFDILLITAVDNHKAILDSIQRIGVPAEKIRFL